MLNIWRVLIVAIGVTFGPMPAIGGAITAPNNFYVGNYLPFGARGNVTYQQVYASSFFTEPISISALTFHLATPWSSSGFVAGDYLVSLSTFTMEMPNSPAR